MPAARAFQNEFAGWKATSIRERCIIACVHSGPRTARGFQAHDEDGQNPQTIEQRSETASDEREWGQIRAPLHAERAAFVLVSLPPTRVSKIPPQ